MQLRALDWDVAGPFQNFPQITVYHPRDASDGNTFANIGWCACSTAPPGRAAEASLGRPIVKERLAGVSLCTSGPLEERPGSFCLCSPSPLFHPPFLPTPVCRTIWIGSITGMSAEKMAISEIGVSNPDATFGNMSRVGVPFTFLLRDILQFDTSLQQSLDRISNANRTCDLILGVGDGKVGAAEDGRRGVRGRALAHSTLTPPHTSRHAP